ncbi:LysE/ArgO family amino acid transporter [Neisseriaceae bacterium TC5R-5]|nr:LysE/ArgO family amino acid transporter [Neisseriaceae bacterium TC5R-5]
MAFFSGLFLGLSLIFAIGAQNAFILKQGLRKEYVFTLCLICAISDAILISIGVFGFSMLTTQLPSIEPIARYGGAIFLLYYGAKSFWAAFKSNAVINLDSLSKTPFTKAILMCLAFTWLNPHVYLDTMMLLGSISTQYPYAKTQFALGATFASFIFFFSLGYGARLLTPLFQQPQSWKILDGIIGVLMWLIAYSLL